MSEAQNNFDSGFRDSVIAGLAEVKAQNVMILARLDRINGSVANVTQKANMLDISLTAHPLNCSMREKIEKLSASISSGDYPMSTDADLRLTAAAEKISTLELHVSEWMAAAKAAKLTSKNWLATLMPLLYLLVGGIFTLFLLHAPQFLKAVKP